MFFIIKLFFVLVCIAAMPDAKIAASQKDLQVARVEEVTVDKIDIEALIKSVKAGENYKEATREATAVMTSGSSSRDEMYKAQELFAELFQAKHEPAYVAAEEWAKQAIVDKSKAPRAKNIFELLHKHNRGHEAAKSLLSLKGLPILVSLYVNGVLKLYGLTLHLEVPNMLFPKTDMQPNIESVASTSQAVSAEVRSVEAYSKKNSSNKISFSQKKAQLLVARLSMQPTKKAEMLVAKNALKLAKKAIIPVTSLDNRFSGNPSKYLQQGSSYPTAIAVEEVINEFWPRLAPVKVTEFAGGGFTGVLYAVATANKPKQNIFFAKVSNSKAQDAVKNLQMIQESFIGRLMYAASPTDTSTANLPILTSVERLFTYRGTRLKQYTIEVTHAARGDMVYNLLTGKVATIYSFKEIGFSVGKALGALHCLGMQSVNFKDPKTLTVHGDLHQCNMFFHKTSDFSRVYFIDNETMAESLHNPKSILKDLMYPVFVPIIGWPRKAIWSNYVQFLQGFLNGYIAAYHQENQQSLTAYLKKEFLLRIDALSPLVQFDEQKLHDLFYFWVPEQNVQIPSNELNDIKKLVNELGENQTNNLFQNSVGMRPIDENKHEQSVQDAYISEFFTRINSYPDLKKKKLTRAVQINQLLDEALVQKAINGMSAASWQKLVNRLVAAKFEKNHFIDVDVDKIDSTKQTRFANFKAELEAATW